MNNNIFKQLIKSDFVAKQVIDENTVKKSHESLQQKYAFPASKKMALKHMRATKFGGRSKQNFDPCMCCQQNSKKSQFGICQRTTPKNFRKKTSRQQSEHYFDSPDDFQMNSGAAMLFVFIKIAIIYLIIHSGIVQIYNIITNSNSFYDQQVSFWTKYSIVNKSSQKQEIRTVEILSLAMVAFSIIFFLIMHKIKYLIWKKIDVARQTQDDYAIFVKNIPIIGQRIIDRDSNIQYNQELQFFFRQKIDQWLRNSLVWQNPSPGSIQYDYHNRLKGPDIAPDDSIKSITLCYNTDSLLRIDQLRKSMMNKHTKNYSKNIKSKPGSAVQISAQDRFKLSAKQYAQKKKQIEKINIIPRQISMLNQSELLITKEICFKKNFIDNVTQFLGSAFVCFKYQHYRDIMLQIAEMSPELMKFQGQQLKISEGFNPTEVKWKNLSISDSQRKKRNMISIMILTLVLSFALAIIVAIYYITEILQQKLQYIVYFQINMLSIVILIIIGNILQLIIYELVSWERHQTITDAKFSLVKKLVIFQFINNALIYFIVFEIKGGKFNNTNDRIGLVSQISWLLVISANLQIFFNVLNLKNIIRKVYLWIYYRGNYDQVPQFQINLNQAYEYAQFDIAQRYSYYIVQIFTASFYAYLVPIGIPTLAIVFSIQYWIDKYTLFKNSSMKYVVNYTLTKNMFMIFQYCILLYTLGMLIFSTKINEQIQPFPVIAFGVSALYLLIANGLPSKIIKILEEFSYDQNVRAGKFVNTYWGQNPFTKLLDQKMVANTFKSSKSRQKLSNKNPDSSILQKSRRLNNRQSAYKNYQTFPTEQI